jgi:hypothetical protein
MINRQESFNRVCDRARVNPTKALDEKGNCLYRTNIGHVCFMGALIPEAGDKAFAEDLQGIHDNFPPPDWKMALKAYAAIWNLKYAAPS